MAREAAGRDGPVNLKLFFSPGACSRVTLIALEETGASFETELVAFMAGEHKAPAYLALNPAGKVPTLLVEDRPLAQNVAILTFLARSFPDAGLMPFTGDAFEDAELLSELVWCSSDLHPLVTRLRIPNFFCDLPGAPERVRQMAEAPMAAQLAKAEARLRERSWFLGDHWSAIDAYLYWVWFRITGAGFDAEPFPALVRHAAKMEERPAVRRALAREAEAEAELKSRGLAFVPPPR